ncbi:MAG TPA: LPS assembly lipoprotein LptE [Candidatus Cybelea sp.]|nr:LPS assembly lipoprotein LptE [Candidatus Cybelea sp.]
MWWSRAFALACILLLGACGFRPLYGTSQYGAGTSPELESINVGTVLSRASPRTAQLLRNDLLDRLTPDGPPRNLRYTLSAAMVEAFQDVVVNQQSEVTRRELLLQVSYQLYDARNNQLVHQGTARAASSYDVLRADFGNVAAERDVRQRLARELAEQMRGELATWFARGVAPAH